MSSNKVAWPSGLRRWFKAPVSSGAWVRIPPLPNLLTENSGIFSKKYVRGHTDLNHGPIGLQPIALPLSYTPKLMKSSRQLLTCRNSLQPARQNAPKTSCKGHGVATFSTRAETFCLSKSAQLKKARDS